MLIDAGIDGLHPLQAKAKGMDAQSLAREYGNDLVSVSYTHLDNSRKNLIEDIVNNKHNLNKNIFEQYGYFVN